MQLGSLCELGKSAPNPVLSTLRYFRSEYEAHIRDKACPAGVCRELTAFEIIEEGCDGCHVCFKACPVDAIEGVVKELHVIHQDACISCGACLDVCPTNTIRTFPKIELKKAEVV
jgi:Na+-translocating ferredoxin:NAD+ oxidoreductase RNF subunit RnfB